MRISLLLSAVILAALPAGAQPMSRESSPSRSQEVRLRSKAKPSQDNRIVFDAAPLAVKGFGGSYERTIARRFTLGLAVSSFSFDIETGGNLKADVLMYGLRGRAFLSPRADRSSGYVVLGANMLNVTGDATLAGTPRGQKTLTEPGALGGIGYQWITRQVLGSSRMLFNLGALYAQGYAVRMNASSVGLQPTVIDDLKTEGSVFFEASLGIIF